jgi:hypothetical protein
VQVTPETGPTPVRRFVRARAYPRRLGASGFNTITKSLIAIRRVDRLLSQSWMLWEGWEGPPFDPFELAARAGIVTAPRDDLERRRRARTGRRVPPDALETQPPCKRRFNRLKASKRKVPPVPHKSPTWPVSRHPPGCSRGNDSTQDALIARLFRDAQHPGS